MSVPDHFEHDGLRVRPWEPADRAAGADVIAATLCEYGLSYEPDDSDHDAHAIERHYLKAGGGFWVVEDENGRVVGTAGYRPWAGLPGTAEIRKMYLLPCIRGRGLGRRLLAFLEDQARAAGHERVMLETASVLREAVALYEQAGYRDASDTIETRRCDRILVKAL